MLSKNHHPISLSVLIPILLGLTIIVFYSYVFSPLLPQNPIGAIPDLATELASPPQETRFGQLPLYFIENQGQLDERVAYTIEGRDKTLFFTAEGITFALLESEAEVQNSEQASENAAIAPVIASPRQADIARYILKLDFIGADPTNSPVGLDPTPAQISYFKGSPEQWQTGLPTYSQIVYHDLWPGIDLVYSGTVNELKYTFVVQPGANPDHIRLAYRGVSALEINEQGQLAVYTPGGGFHDDTPYAYQEINGKQLDVAASYVLEADAPHEYAFQLSDYDQNYPLIIDPAVLVYAGYIGGSGNEQGEDIEVDSAGNAYIVGATTSTAGTFPETVGPDVSHNGGTDAFVAKVNPSGTALLYAGYIGGSGYDHGLGIDVDNSGNAYITGFTDSSEGMGFPVTGGPDLTYNGAGPDPRGDVFVAKINSSGTGLVYAGYIGGSNDEIGFSIAVDNSGRAYVAGLTNSPESGVVNPFPATVGPDLIFNDPSVLPNSFDAFVARVNAAGSGLEYAGYIGGSSDDRGYGIALDSANNAYISGQTASNQTTFPETIGPGLTHNGGDDAFVAKVNSSGTALVYAGYIGGSSGEGGLDVAVDSSGRAYVTGSTSSSDFTTLGGPDTSYNGSGDAFIARVNASGSGLEYSGFFGGSGSDRGTGVAVSSDGSAYISGDTTSSNLPTVDGPDLTANGGTDVFVAKIQSDGMGLEYAGYIGGSGDDRNAVAAGDIAVDNAGNAYVTGQTTSNQSTFPVTVGPDLTHNGGQDAFVAKIGDAADLTLTKHDSPDPVTVGNLLTYTILVTNSGSTATGVTLTDTLPANVTFSTVTPSQGSCGLPNPLVCNLGSLATDATARVTIEVTPTVVGALVNMATVGSNESDPTPADNTATATTTVEDILVRFSNSTYSVNENAGAASIAVTLNAAPVVTTTVAYATSNGSATAGSDYVAASGVLTFAPGETTQMFNVTISDDSLDEPNETVILTLSSPNNAALGTPNPATLTITDNDPTPTVQFSAAAYSVAENGGTVTITATLSAASGQTVMVTYATSNGTATAGSDYTTTGGMLTFSPGVTVQTLSVPILNDTLNEADETVILTLSSPTNATLGVSNPATLTIIDDDPTPTVQFSNAAYTVAENGGMTTITATLSAASGQTVMVNYATSNGTAASGSDYTAASGTLTFLPGQTSQAFSVTIIDDPLDEPNETVNLTLSTPISADLGTPNPATLTITDDDPTPTVQFSATAYSLVENGGTAVMTATLSAASGQTVTVNYASSNGTATAGSDYTSTGGTLTFLPGQTNQTFSVTVIDDALDEPNETVNLTLSSPTNVALGTPNPVTLTILDDDGQSTLSINDVSVIEGNGGGVNAVFEVSLLPASSQAVTVEYATADSTATTPLDYTAIPTMTLNFPVGEISQLITVTVQGDILNEANETFAVNLANPVNTTITDNQGVGTILDDDGVSAVQFSTAAYSVAENGGLVTITATLSAASGQTVMVNYTSSNGTATAGSDYTATSGILTFTPGQTSKTFNVTLIDDTLNEANETVILTLSSPANATLGTPNPATLTIIDNDPMPTVQFNTIAYSVAENGGPATSTATLSTASGQTVMVNYATSNGTAIVGSDYIAASGSLIFLPGQTSQTFSVGITDDMLDEANETVMLTLDNPTNVVLGSLNPATLTIVDNDPGPNLSINNVSAIEGNGGAMNATFNVTLLPASGRTVAVDYATADDSALAPADYTAVASTTLTFTPGMTSQLITVLVQGDVIDEPNETFFVNLTNAINATLVEAQGVGTILDDDGLPSLAIDDANVVEGDAGAINALFNVTLLPANSQTVTVEYATVNGTALAPADYTAISPQTLTFTPGMTHQVLAVPVQGDTTDEANEIFFITLTDPISATLADNQGLGTILDDDNPPKVSFSQNTYSVAEGAGIASITVTLNAVSELTATVKYTSSNSTAQAPDDYLTATGTLTFIPGQTKQAVDITINDDSLIEADETLHLTLDHPTNAILSVPTTVPLTIRDNDASSISSTLYLPLIIRDHSLAPDLVITSLLVSQSGVTVTIKNIGNAPVIDAFWVDVYINPIPPPSQVNQHWWDLAGQGLVWGITDSILVGGELTLTIGDAYYSSLNSNFSGVIPLVTPVWAQVDSVNLNTLTGGVLESDERNNIAGPALPAVIGLNQIVSPGQRNVQSPASPGQLPLR